MSFGFELELCREELWLQIRAAFAQIYSSTNEEIMCYDSVAACSAVVAAEWPLESEGGLLVRFCARQ